LIDNPPGEVLIVQKILTESFDWRDVYLLKRRPYVGKLHTKAGEGVTSPAKSVFLFTKSCEQNMHKPPILFTSYSRGFSRRKPDVITAPWDA
jgi:hypothetical protein